MSTVAAGRIERRRTRTREALLDAAERAFTTRAFHEVRVEDLAAEADVSVGSVYNQFDGKAGLYLAVADRATRLFDEYLQRAYEVSDSPLEQVMAGGDAYLRFHIDQPGAFRLIAATGIEGTPAAAALRDRAERVMATFEELIASAIAGGEIDAAIDPALTARFLFGAWNGIVALSERDDRLGLDEEGVANAVAQARRIVLEGLTDPAHRGPDGRSPARLLPIAEGIGSSQT
ncbi:MAG: TetR/AcrR family transcriptional regulator [Solirubrobacterales bacterium]